MGDMLINLLCNLIWFLGGLIITKLIIVFKVKLPIKRIWQISNPDKLTVVVATSSQTHTGEYVRPSTGVGQVRALAVMLKSLNRGYRGIDVSNIYLSNDALHERLERDLLILGGPKTNEISVKFLKELELIQPFNQLGSDIIYKNNPSLKSSTHYIYRGITEQDKVVTDYGLIIRARNPFSRDPRTAILISGSHTYGTVAAAIYFTEMIHRDIDNKYLKSLNLSILVSTYVIDEYPTKIKLEKFYTW